MTDSASQQLEQWIAAEQQRPDPAPDRAQQVWSGVESRLAGTTSAPPWAPAAGRPLWPWLVVGALALATLGGLAAAPAPAARGFETGSAVALQTPSSPSPNVKVASMALAQAPAAVPAVASRRNPSPALGNQPSFAEELALIERARKALASKQNRAVLAATREHRKTFPKGALREEAAALRTAATCATNGGQESQNAAAEFEKRWARSVHADLVRRHCR